MFTQGLLQKASVLSLGALLWGSVAYAADTGGFSNTSGGDNYSATTVSSLSQLRAAFNAGSHHIIIRGTIYGGAQLTTLTFANTNWNNTTIEGAPGGQAVLENIQLKFDGEQLSSGTNIENIKVSNITFHGNIRDLQNLPTQVHGSSNNVGINYEGVSLRRISNALITHCTFYDTSDDLMSVALSSDYVTISYNHFYFTHDWTYMSPDPVWNWVGSYTDLAGERLAMVIGANSSDSYIGTGRLHVTVHHNWFGPYMRGRPLFRGWVHVYSNYFDNHPAVTGSRTGSDGHSYPVAQYEAIQINSGSVVVSEDNYFYYTNNSNTISQDSSGYSYRFYERNNIYNNTTGNSATGSSFGNAVSYSYTPTAAASVPNYVQSNAGPQ
ncbi:pectate lyase [Celerinatantimonas sp. YJH-8]|uniref:pectate lyase n=1 Tax=Celerinatantimonas sp. YJH-8 TaxID=3228714 RepID=UPI0038C3D0D5